MQNSLFGKFIYLDELLDAAHKLNLAGFSFKTFSPIPILHELEEVFGPPAHKRLLRYFTLFGGVTGLIMGFIIVLGTAALYVLPRGGRPIFSITPTLLISYETTILFGVGMTLLGFVFLAGLPAFKLRIDEPEIGSDTFGLLIEGIREDKFEYVRSILLEHGASEVKKFEEN